MASIHTLGNGPFLFTREGFRELKDRIKSFGKTHQHYLAQFGETRPVQFKDEMDSERAELERGETCINSQVAVLQHYLQFGEIAPDPVDDGLLTIGKIVTLARGARLLLVTSDAGAELPSRHHAVLADRVMAPRLDAAEVELVRAQLLGAAQQRDTGLLVALQVRQVGVLLDHLASCDEPVVLAGDFNATLDHAALQRGVDLARWNLQRRCANFAEEGQVHGHAAQLEARQVQARHGAHREFLITHARRVDPRRLS